jgi:hypothetical protein
MSRRGQIIIIIAVLIPVVLLLLAVAVDAGRLYIESAQLERALQSGADAGISLVAEQMVTLAVARQTETASTPSPELPLVATPMPSPDDVVAWLTDDDRARLVSPAMRATAQAEALAYAARNGIDATNPDILEIAAVYPQSGFNPYDDGVATLRLELIARRRATILLAGLLGSEFAELSGEAISELRIR